MGLSSLCCGGWCCWRALAAGSSGKRAPIFLPPPRTERRQKGKRDGVSPPSRPYLYYSTSTGGGKRCRNYTGLEWELEEGGNAGQWRKSRPFLLLFSPSEGKGSSRWCGAGERSCSRSPSGVASYEAGDPSGILLLRVGWRWHYLVGECVWNSKHTRAHEKEVGKCAQSRWCAVCNTTTVADPLEEEKEGRRNLFCDSLGKSGNRKSLPMPRIARNRFPRLGGTD